MSELDPERGARIRALRKERRRTQVATAEAVGVTERAYQQWEYGGEISWHNAVALASFLGVDAGDMMDGDEGPPVDSEERRLRRAESVELLLREHDREARSAAEATADRLSELEKRLAHVTKAVEELGVAVRKLTA